MKQNLRCFSAGPAVKHEQIKRETWKSDAEFAAYIKKLTKERTGVDISLRMPPTPTKVADAAPTKADASITEPDLKHRRQTSVVIGPRVTLTVTLTSHDILWVVFFFSER